MFDPYHKWLAIPKDQRPPTHYQLLGISPNESDVEVLKEAALRQTSHVRTYQTGSHAQECTRLLNEIAQARAVLLNPADRKEYDGRLAQAANPNNSQPRGALPGPCPPPFAATGETFSEPVAVPVAAPPPEFFAQKPLLTQGQRIASSYPSYLPGKKPFWREPAAMGYVTILLLGGAVSFWLTSQSLSHSSSRQRGTSNPTSVIKPAPSDKAPFPRRGTAK